MIIKLLKYSIIQAFQFKIALLGAVATQCLWAFLKIVILASCFQNSTTIGENGVSLPEAVGYVWIGQAFFRLIPLQGEVVLQSQIKDGSIIYLLSKPLHIYKIFFIKVLTFLTVDIFTRCIPLLLVALTFSFIVPQWGLRYTLGYTNTYAFFMTTISALLLSCSIITLVTTCSFLTISSDGINTFLPPLALISTGILVPLPLYPDWLKSICEWLPFSGILHFPALVFLNKLDHVEIFQALIYQACWSAGLILLGNRILKSGISRMTYQGG